MAFRLARMCGRLDVDAMLDEVTPEMIDEWIAYYRIEPFGDDWGPATKICETVSNLLVTEEKDLFDASEFRPLFPGQKKPERRRSRMVKPDQARAAIQARYGRHGSNKR